MRDPYNCSSALTIQEIRRAERSRLPSGMNPYTGRPLTIWMDEPRSLRERMEAVKGGRAR
jgi:hypothetical protein